MKFLKKMLALICAISISLTSIPVSIYGDSSINQKSTELSELTVFAGLFSSKPATQSVKLKSATAKLIEGSDNIYYAEIKNLSMLAYLRISGLTKSESAQVQIIDMADQENIAGLNLNVTKGHGYRVEGGKLVQIQDNQKAFVTLETTTQMTKMLKAYYGTGVYKMIVTDDGLSKEYYLLISENKKSAEYLPDDISLLNSQGTELEEQYQYAKGITTKEEELAVCGNQTKQVIPDDIESIKIRLNQQNLTIPKNAYYPGTAEAFYTGDNYSISMNGSEWESLIKGEISPSLNLKNGYNILQIVSTAPENLIKSRPVNSGPYTFGSCTILLYREGIDASPSQQGTDTSLKQISIYQAAKDQTTAQNYNELLSIENLTPTDNIEQKVSLYSASPYIYLRAETNDSDADIKLTSSVGHAQKINGGYYLQLNHEEDSVIPVNVIPANENELLAHRYEIKIDWTVTESCFSNITVRENGHLTSEYKSDKKEYYLIPDDYDKNVVIYTTGGENVKVLINRADSQETELTDGNISVDPKTVHQVIFKVTAQDGTTNSYTIVIQRRKPESFENVVSKINPVLQNSIDQYKINKGKNMNSQYWDIFAMASAGQSLDDYYIYDVTKHNLKQATDYAAIILELVMVGENPFDFNGIDYVQGLLNCKNEDTKSYGPYACNIWALYALDAVGYYDEDLINIVAAQAVSKDFDLDMRGWALAAIQNHLDVDGIAEKSALAAESFKLRQDGSGPIKGSFENFYYNDSNALSHACAIMGLAAAKINLEEDDWKVDGVSPLDRYYENENPVTLPSSQPIIALSGLVNQSNVWIDQCLNLDKINTLIEEAQKLEKDSIFGKEITNRVEKLKADLKEKSDNMVYGLGEQYYELYDLVGKVNDDWKPDTFMGTETEKAAVEAVIEKIDSIETVTPDKITQSISEARKAYNELKEKRMLLTHYVTNDYVLSKYEEDYKNVITVINAIDVLPDTATLADEAAIDAADELYKALSEQEQKGVYNYSKIASLRKQIDKIKSDQAAVTNVISLINALPDASRVTVADETKINHANQAYNALDASLKEQITNVYKLIEVQRKLTNLLEAQAVIDKISSIGTLTVQNFADKEVPVIEARTLYNALTTEQKTLVTNYSLLEDAEVFIKENKVDADIADIIGKIDELRTTSDPAGNRIDGPLKETEKNNGVPTKAIWDSWKDYVVNVRGLVDGIDSSRQSLISNLSSLVKAEDYIRQLNFQELKDMMNALPDASVIAPYTASERAGAEPAEVFEEETSVVESVDTEEIAQSAEEISEEAETQEVISVETADPEALPEEEIPEYVGASRRPLTDTEITELVDAEMAFEVLSAADQKAFDEQNTSLVANMNALLEMAETYPVYKTQKLQKFADNASKVYAQIMEVPVTCDTLASVQALLDTYNNCYGSDKEALASVTVTVGNKTISFADVIAEIQKQVDKTTKNVVEAREIDEWIMNLPTELTPANIDSVEKEVKAVKAAIEKLGTEGTSYLYNKKQLELVEQLVTNYRRAQKEKEEQEKAAFKEHKITGMKAVSLSYNSAQITWSELSEADGYQVYAKSSRGGTYKKIATITEKETICYTHKNLTTGETYYYKVRAYATISGEKIYSGFSSVKTAKIVPTAVKLSSAQAKGTSATVKWYKVSGASGYAVYRATSQNGKYTRVGTIKKGSTVSYTDSGLKSKKDYYYKVRAYRTVNGKNVYGSYSAVKQVYSGFSAMKFSSVQAKSTSIILKWYKVSGASGYAVYRATSQNGKYTRVGTIKKGSTVSYTDSRLKSKKNYYYKVRAYRTVNGKNVYGSYSAVKKVKTK